MRPIALTLGAALLASTALAQQSTEGVEDPSAETIQGSTVLKDTMEIPNVEDGEQAIEVDGAEPTGDVPRTAGSGTTGGEGSAEATEAVDEMVEEGEVTDAEPTENWFGCDPEAENNPDHCEQQAETDADTALPSKDDVGETDAVRDGGVATTVRPPTGENDAVDNLTTDTTAPEPANPDAAVTSMTAEEGSDPDRPQELENEPQAVLPSGDIDMEEDAQVVPETATSADIPTE